MAAFVTVTLFTCVLCKQHFRVSFFTNPEQTSEMAGTCMCSVKLYTIVTHLKHAHFILLLLVHLRCVHVHVYFVNSISESRFSLIRNKHQKWWYMYVFCETLHYSYDCNTHFMPLLHVHLRCLHVHICTLWTSFLSHVFTDPEQTAEMVGTCLPGKGFQANNG